MDGGSENGAGVDASFALFFEELIAVELTKSRPMTYYSKIIELQLTDIHTIVSFLKKRIHQSKRWAFAVTHIAVNLMGCLNVAVSFAAPDVTS